MKLWAAFRYLFYVVNTNEFGAEWWTMSNERAEATGQPPRSTAWQSAVTVVQEARPPFIPEGAEVMTVIIEFHPGRPWHAAAPAPGTGVRLHAGRRDAI
jgi:hypothetical protein